MHGKVSTSKNSSSRRKRVRVTSSTTTSVSSICTTTTTRRAFLFSLIVTFFIFLSTEVKPCWGVKTVTANPNKKDPRSTSASSSSSSSSSTPTKSLPRRERNLDHWDGDTLAFYLNLDPKTGKQLSSGKTAGAAATGNPSYPGYDVAVMFYAPWDRNSHTVAQYWDRIATYLKAGTSSKSKLIMALFDCERSLQHEKLCIAASVTHYPTFMFVGAGPFHDTDVISRSLVGKKRAAGPAGPTSIRHAVKFQGNWLLPESILTWIQTMQLLSRWHVASTKGWLRVLRIGILGVIFPPLRRKHNAAAAAGGGGGTAAASIAANGRVASGAVDGGLPIGLPLGPGDAQVSALEKQVKELSSKTKDYSKLILRSSAVVDALLFPLGQPSQVTAVDPNNQTNATSTTNTTTTTSTTNSTSGGSYASNNFTDVFALLQQRSAWNMTVSSATKGSTAETTTYVILSCALDILLDVCQRVNTHVTTDVAENYPREDIFRNYTKLDHMLNTLVEQREPYCGIVDACLLKNFKPAVCRPSTCPFQDPVACRYLTACLSEPIQTEYAVALNLIQEGQTFPPPPPPSSSSSSAKTKQQTSDSKNKDDKNKKGGLWGMF